MLAANFFNSRRESELSELQRGLRSVSANDGRLCYSGGHMPGKNQLTLNQGNFTNFSIVILKPPSLGFLDRSRLDLKKTNGAQNLYNAFVLATEWCTMRIRIPDLSSSLVFKCSKHFDR